MAVQLIQRVFATILLAAGSAAIAAAPSGGVVKKSKVGICHERGTPGYKQTKKNFQVFDTVAACLKSGGRLPKTLASKKSRLDPSKPAHAGDEGVLYGPLVRVIDGDTLIVQIQGVALHFRLAGIDAPESDQRFGDIARYLLAGLIGGEKCVLVYEEGDVYGRLVAHLWIGDMYVNAEIVKRGMAWFDSQSAPNNLLELDEEEARDAKRGLWALPLEERTPPWDWRHEQR